MSRPKERQKHEIAKYYRLSRKQSKQLTISFIEQLRRCKSEESRRILLGVSK